MGHLSSHSASHGWTGEPSQGSLHAASINRKYPSPSPSAESLRDTNMRYSRGHSARTVQEKNYPNSSANDQEDADVVFLTEWARKYPAKEGARLSGMTPKGFQKLQAGDNGISYKRLRQWMRNDIAFAIAHAVETGLILPGQAESAKAVTLAVNAYLQQGKE